VSTNAGNNAKAKLESTRFQQDNNTINQQITDFYINVAVLEAARDKKLETLELWAFITSAIKGKNWTYFRLTMSMQKEYKDQYTDLSGSSTKFANTSWPSRTIKTLPLRLKARKKSVLNAAQASSSDSSSTDDLREVISRLAASVAAITSKAETASRVKNNKCVGKRSAVRREDRTMLFLRRRPQASRLPHPEDSLS
jgi:hypothetical protein